MQTSNAQIIVETNRFFRKVYAWMALGLVLSGLTALVIANSPTISGIIFSNPIVIIIIIIAQLLLVGSLAGWVQRMSSTMAVFVFLLYCLTTGITLSSIFLVYTMASIGNIFFITAGMFGFMSIYGFVTNDDLSGFGRIGLMGLVGIIIASIVNIWIRNSQFDLIISCISIMIFTALTAYDTQRIKAMGMIGYGNAEEDTKKSIMGALTLYLDFINIFVQLLHLFGKRK